MLSQEVSVKFVLILLVIIFFFGCAVTQNSENLTENTELKKVLDEAHYFHFDMSDSLIFAAKIIYSDLSSSYAYELTVINTGNKPLLLDYTADNLYYQYQGEQILCRQLMDRFHYPSRVNPGKTFLWTYLVDAKYNDVVFDIEGLTYVRGFIPFLLAKNKKAHWNITK